MYTQVKDETDFLKFAKHFDREFAALYARKETCQCLAGRMQILWENSDKASPEDVEQIYTAVFDLPPEWWHYKVARPANASIQMLPDVLQPMWYEAFDGVAQVLKQWRHMEGISRVLHGLSEEQYAHFLDEIQGVMMQIASCGNQFRIQNKNFSYKHYLAKQILIRIIRGEWTKDQQDLAKILEPRLHHFMHSKFHIRPEQLAMHDFKQFSWGEKLMKELPEMMKKIKIRTRQDYFD